MSTTVPYGNDRCYYKDGNVSNVTLGGYRHRPAGYGYVPWARAGLGHAPGAAASGPRPDWRVLPGRRSQLRTWPSLTGR
jgi:hypothetical protein